MYALRVFHHEDVARVVAKVAPKLVAKVGIGVALPDNLYGSCDSDGTVVGGYHNSVAALGETLEEVIDHRVAEPAQSDAAVGFLVVGKLTHHLRFRAGVAKHVDEVEHHHVEVVALQLVEALQEFLRRGGIVNLVVGKSVVAAEAVELCLQQRRLVEVLAFLVVLVNPQMWKHLRYLVGHQSAEDGVARILRGCGQDAVVELFVNFEKFAKVGSYHAPLVVAEIVEHHEKDLLACVEGGEKRCFHHLRTKYRSVGGMLSGLHYVVHPRGIVLHHKLRESVVGLLFLHGEDVEQWRVVRW